MARSKRRRIVRVGLIKAESAWGDAASNLDLLETLCRPLAGERVDVFVTPECFLDGYMVRKKSCTAKKLSACAVSGPGDPAVKRVGRLAKRLSSYLVLGASEWDGKRTFRNAAYLLDRSGRVAGTYYKTHPGDRYAPGDHLPVFATDFATVGIVICADRRWPENIRCLRLKRAEIILNPTWGMWGDLNTALMRTRAYENGLPVCFAHPQQSLICGADGRIEAILESNRPDVLIHDVDLSGNVPVKRTRDAAGSRPIQNRRPELYGPLVER